MFDSSAAASTHPPASNDFTRPQSCALLSTVIAVAGLNLRYFYARGLSNLYGDGISHVEGARRIFDSLSPGYHSIGSVWLPLCHVLVSPLAQNDFLWRTGLAGSIVSTLAFIATAWLALRLGFGLNQSRAAGLVALAGVLISPNLLYTAATPLTEPMAIFFTTLLVYLLYRFASQPDIFGLCAAGAAACAGTLTRYDGWYILPFAALYILLLVPGTPRERFWRTFTFGCIASLGPLLWVVHNAIQFGNPLEFYNGPYSAQAIYAHQLATTGFRYPTDGSMGLSARYFIEDLKLVFGAWPLELSMLGLLAVIVDSRQRRQRAVVLVSLFALPFYIQSMAHAGVPIYVPTLFPNTYYNLRYGLEMAPAVALLPSMLLTSSISKLVRRVIAAIILLILASQAVRLCRHGASELVVVKEAVLNSPCKSPEQQWLIGFMESHYDGGGLLMAAGEWPCLMPSVGIHLSMSVTDVEKRYWNRLPAGAGKLVRWVIVRRGDRVDELMQGHPSAFLDFSEAGRDNLPKGDWIAVYLAPRASRRGPTIP
jgi:hypothetical protein